MRPSGMGSGARNEGPQNAALQSSSCGRVPSVWTSAAGRSGRSSRAGGSSRSRRSGVPSRSRRSSVSRRAGGSGGTGRSRSSGVAGRSSRASGTSRSSRSGVSGRSSIACRAAGSAGSRRASCSGRAGGPRRAIYTGGACLALRAGRTPAAAGAVDDRRALLLGDHQDQVLEAILDLFVGHRVVLHDRSTTFRQHDRALGDCGRRYQRQQARRTDKAGNGCFLHDISPESNQRPSPAQIRR